MITAASFRHYFQKKVTIWHRKIYFCTDNRRIGLINENKSKHKKVLLREQAYLPPRIKYSPCCPSAKTNYGPKIVDWGRGEKVWVFCVDLESNKKGHFFCVTKNTSTFCFDSIWCILWSRYWANIQWPIAVTIHSQNNQSILINLWAMNWRSMLAGRLFRCTV